MGETKRAIEVLNEAAKIDPELASTQFMLYQLIFDSGSKKLSSKYLKKAQGLSQHPEYQVDEVITLNPKNSKSLVSKMLKLSGKYPDFFVLETVHLLKGIGGAKNLQKAKMLILKNAKMRNDPEWKELRNEVL